MRVADGRFRSYPPTRSGARTSAAVLDLLGKLRRAWATSQGNGALVPELLRCEQRFTFCLRQLAGGQPPEAIADSLDSQFGRDAGHRPAIVRFILQECVTRVRK